LPSLCHYFPGFFDCPADPLITGAAAEIAFQPLSLQSITASGVLLEQGKSIDQKTGSAVPALEASFFKKSLLYSCVVQAFNSGYSPAGRFDRQHQAGFNRQTVK
jgi:hypothetical protein